MPIVLVVDDSPVDQKLVGGLLTRDFDWIIEYADDGESALQKISDIFPDIVITDLQMPKMNGIDLCRQTRIDFPHVPVILTTGMGSESLAAEALQAGAASYVPKSALAQSLPDTVEQILEHGRKAKCQLNLMAFATRCRHQFKLDNDPNLIPPLLDFVRQTMNSLKVGDPTAIRHACVSLEEAINNALYHGNLELNETQAFEARHAFREGKQHEFVQQRLSKEPYRSRQIKVAIDLTRTIANFVVRDQGNGFDTSQPTLSTTDSAVGDSNRRGITLIKNFMNDVSFNPEGNEIRMALNVV